AAPRLLRAARRLAESLRAEWVVVHVERPTEASKAASRDHLVDVLAFANELGAETAILSGPDVADELIAYARQRNASRIVVGKPSRPRWVEAVLGSVVSSLSHHIGVDVFVLSAEHEDEAVRAPARTPEQRFRWQPYGRSAGIVLASTALAAIM